MEINFVLSLPRDAASVWIVRHLCGDALARIGVQPGCIHDIQLAITEACTNVLQHAHGKRDQYEVKLRVEGRTALISVSDAGVGLDPSIDRRGPADSAESGRGILLMNNLVDHLRFVSKRETGTIVHLEKVLELTDASILHKLSFSAA